ncbi:MAG: inositol 2-dehydrogenase [Pseudomonadota bacterium]
MLKLGLLGCGRIGAVHAKSIQRLPNAALVAVSDAQPEAAEAMANANGADVRDSKDLARSADIDAVIIGTPTDTHFDLIHSAAEAGKAIFCEKPIDLSANNIRACKKVVEEACVPFMTAFNRRFDPNFANLQTRLASGEIGAVEILTILSRDPSPPPASYIKASGGLFRDMMIHDLDMARFLLGEDPVSVFAVGSCLVDPQIEKAGDVDTAAVTLTTARGTICQISNSRRASYGYDQRIEMHGSEGMLRAANVQEDTIEVANARGFRSAPAKAFFLERYEAAYLSEMSYFVTAVLHDQPISPDITDGLKAQLLADAATQSASEKRPVTVNLNNC